MSIYVYQKNSNFFTRSDGISAHIRTVSPVDRQPANTDVYILPDARDTAVTFFVVLSINSLVNKYTWQVSTNGGSTYSDIPNSDSSSLTVNNLTINDDNNYYRCIINLDSLTVISTPGILGVSYLNGEDPTGITIISQPVNTTLALDGTASFSVVASSDQPISYVWQVSDNNGFSFQDIESSNTSVLSLTNLDRSDHKQIYQAKVYLTSNPLIYKNSIQSLLFTNVEIDILQQPQTTVAINNSARFSVVANTPKDILTNISYQWQKSTDDGENYFDIVGAITNTLDLSGLTINDHGNLYRVKMSTSCCGTEDYVVMSDSTILLMVESYILFKTQPQSITTSDTEATFTSEIRNFCRSGCGSITYQWFYIQDGSDNTGDIIPEATTSSLTIDVKTNHKKRFKLVATQPNTESNIESNIVTLINSNAKPTDISISDTFVLEGNEIEDQISVGILTTNSPDQTEVFIYSLTDSYGDNSFFAINEDLLVTNSIFNFATKKTYDIQIRSTDTQGLYYDKIFQIRVRRTPTINLINTINELSENTNVSSDIDIADLTITNPIDDGFLSESALDILGPQPFSLSGSDASSFKIEGLKLKLKANTILDHEEKMTYSITILYTDNFSSIIRDINYTLNIIESITGPTGLSISQSSIEEFNNPEDVVGTFAVTHSIVNPNIVFSLISGNGDTDNSSFSIIGNELQAMTIFDWSIKNTYSIRVRATDDNSLFYDTVFNINITKIPINPPDPPDPDPPPDPDRGGGDPHYFLRPIKPQNFLLSYGHVIDDNIGGEPAIAGYIKIDNEEWKTVIVNTPGIVHSIEQTNFYYRNDGAQWNIVSREVFNTNGFLIFQKVIPYFIEFQWENLKYMTDHDNCRVGGFLYWMKKTIQSAEKRVRINIGTLPLSLRALGVDGIGTIGAAFGLKRDDFLESAGDANLLKISEKFNMFSKEI